MADRGASVWLGTSWLAQLSPSDLSRLRTAAKRQMRKLGWPERRINNREADKLIEWLGPKVVEELKQRAHDKKVARKYLGDALLG